MFPAEEPVGASKHMFSTDLGVAAIYRYWVGRGVYGGMEVGWGGSSEIAHPSGRACTTAHVPRSNASVSHEHHAILIHLVLALTVLLH